MSQFEPVKQPDLITSNSGIVWQRHTMSREARNVLRNTYLMLALTMVPTMLGAWIGLQSGFNMFGILPNSPILSALLVMAVPLAIMVCVARLRNSVWGVALLLVFTGFMGLMLSVTLQVALRFSNGPQLIGMAALSTGAIFLAMASLAATLKRDLSSFGKFLFIGVIALIVASLANIYFQLPALWLAISFIAVLLFSFYLLYDLQRIVRQGETNYIMATMSVYVDLFNIFVNLLNILMVFTGRSE